MSIRLWCVSSALRTAQAHARSLEMEVSGVCLGRVWRNVEDDWFVCVDRCLPALLADSHRASVSMGFDAWATIAKRLDELQEQEPEHDWRIVGWYHSHPGFGIFLSSVDQQTHQVYFAQPWHVALVIDPLRGSKGWFVKNDRGRPVQVEAELLDA